MKKKLGVCAALVICASIAATAPAFAAKDEAIFVEALDQSSVSGAESGEVNGLVPEFHAEEAEASDSEGSERVELSGGDEQLGKDIAMQIAAASPIAIDRSGVTADDIEHEKEVLRKQALEEGKPEKIIEKMVEGRINKFYEEVCLLEQKFVKDPEQKVSAVLGGVEVKAFTRFQLGEGIEKKQEDFAAEVAAQMQ